MSAHTPGPWAIRELTCEDHRGMGWVEDANGADIACCGAKELWQEENRANARLIAAAPELLTALEFIIECVPCPERNCSCHIAPPCNDCVENGALREALDDARAVVAKARSQP